MQKYKLYLDDIKDSIKKIEKYTKGYSYRNFAGNSLVADAVIRNFEIIGEAVKKLPAELKKKYPEIEWKKIAGLRDVLIHEYSGVDLRIIWDVIMSKIPELKRTIEKVNKESDGKKR